MSKFKVGDRVAVYGHSTIKDGHKCTVDLVDDRGMACRMYQGGRLIPVHPKQCRRLKKREPKYLWIVRTDFHGNAKLFTNADDAEMCALVHGVDKVKARLVKC